MKLWLANYPVVYEVPEEAERYSWNGTCLDLKQPEWYDDVTPVRISKVHRAMNGRAIMSTDTDIERYEFLLHVLNITEKEKLAIEEFVEAVGLHSQQGFPYPYMQYHGFQDHDASQFLMIFMPQEITFTENVTTNALVEGELVTSRRYDVDIPVRITRHFDRWVLDRRYIAKFYWLNEEGEEVYPIYLGYEHYPVNQVYGWIEQMDGFTQNSEVHGFGTVSNVSMTIAAFKQINQLEEGHPFRNMDKHIEGITDAHVEIYYVRDRQFHTIFKGRTYTPFRWNEATRMISFECIMNSKWRNLGFQPDYTGNYLLTQNMNKDNWPHVFGQGIFQFMPMCKRPEAQIEEDIYISRSFSNPGQNIFMSGQAWSLPIPEDAALPLGDMLYMIPVEGGGIRVWGQAESGQLTITQFNVPYMTNVPVFPIVQYDPNVQYKKDREEYQPNTLIINLQTEVQGPWEMAELPYIAGKHIRARATRSSWFINSQGKFEEEEITLIYWASIVDQNDNVIFIEDPRNTAGQEITLSGWKTDLILEVMDNRLFQPNSWGLLADEEIKNQRSLKHRRKYIENGEHLAVHIRARSSVVCLNWLFDKVYPISLDRYSVVNHSFLKVDNRLYWVPIFRVFRFEDGVIYPSQYQTHEYQYDWDLEVLKPHLPDNCTFMVLFEHYPEIMCDVSNLLGPDHVVFDYALERYTELTPGTHTSDPLPSNFITRDYVDVRKWLADFCLERGKRIVVERNATAYTTNLDPEITRVFTSSMVELDSISFDSMDIGELETQFRMSWKWIDREFIIRGEQKYAEQEGSYVVDTYWAPEVWEYWADWKSRLWRKVTFKAFMEDLPLVSPQQKIRLETHLFTGNGIVETTQIEDNEDLVTITIFAEEEVI